MGSRNNIHINNKTWAEKFWDKQRNIFAIKITISSNHQTSENVNSYFTQDQWSEFLAIMKLFKLHNTCGVFQADIFVYYKDIPASVKVQKSMFVILMLDGGRCVEVAREAIFKDNVSQRQYI